MKYVIIIIIIVLIALSRPHIAFWLGEMPTEWKNNEKINYAIEYSHPGDSIILIKALDGSVTITTK
jgi:flagellar basal body-associated protein FliL